MRSKSHKLLMSCVLVSCLVTLFSCGKKAEEEKPVPDTIQTPIEDDFDAHLQKQSISCSDASKCPTYITKIVVRHGPGVYKTCTGFLTDSETIATSTTCLPELMRLNGSDCSKDIAFFFFERFSRGLRVGCKSVLQATEDFSPNPILNRDDLAFLKLSESLPFRRTLRLSRDGMGDNKNTRIIGVEQSDDMTGEIKEIDCPSVIGTYVNPLATNVSSPGFTLSGCAFHDGFTGAPVVDGRYWSRVRGVVSVGMDPKIRSYLMREGLLVNGLRDFIHGTNLACAPTIYDNNVSDEKECDKELSNLQVERLRSLMLSTTVLFTDARTRLENSLESSNRFVRFSLKLIPRANPNDPNRPNYDLQDVKVTPKCFKNVSLMNGNSYQQLTNFKMPKRTFRKIMDEWGRVQGIEIENAPVLLGINWNPKEIRKNRFGTLYTWDPVTEIIYDTYTNLPVCE